MKRLVRIRTASEIIEQLRAEKEALLARIEVEFQEDCAIAHALDRGTLVFTGETLH